MGRRFKHRLDDCFWYLTLLIVTHQIHTIVVLQKAKTMLESFKDIIKIPNILENSQINQITARRFGEKFLGVILTKICYINEIVLNVMLF